MAELLCVWSTLHTLHVSAMAGAADVLLEKLFETVRRFCLPAGGRDCHIGLSRL
jgi:hypothetical protein